MMTMKTELLEALVRQCVREVLDQVQEEVNASKLKSSGIGKGDDKEPAKQKTSVPVKFKKSKGFKVNVKKINEEEDPNKSDEKKPEDKPEDKPQEPSPEKGPEASAPAVDPSDPAAPATPAPPTTPGDSPAPAAPPAEAPAATPEVPQRIPKGASLINPKDKSKLDPIKWMGRDDSSIERTLHQVAVKYGGPRMKVSLGAKRLAREAIANPNLPIYFYLGKMDPESEEVFLMADKSLQIAKDDSIQPGELTGTPVINPSHDYPVYGQQNNLDRETDPENKYADWMNRGKRTIGPKPRYGIDEPELNESAAKLIKQAVNKILNS